MLVRSSIGDYKVNVELSELFGQRCTQIVTLSVVDALQHLVATKSRTVAQRKLRGL